MEEFKEPQPPINREENGLPQEKILAAERRVTEALVESTPEAEHAPAWIKEIIKKVADAWFDPKSFGSEEVYEKLGTRIFKKFMPTSGNYVYRLVWKRFFGAEDFVKPNKESLQKYEKWTRAYEGVHTGFLAIGAAVLATQLNDGNLSSAAFTAALNALGNVYPIMLNRYNRLRLFRIISRMEAREAKAEQSEK